MKNFSIIASILVMLTVSGCSKLTEANYAKLKPGMSYDEVTQVIGRAEQCSETIGLKHCVWGNAEQSISADFLADKALVFSSNNIR
jgi:hypothetical protein